MKRILFLLVWVFTLTDCFAQEDNSLIDRYDKKVEENAVLKNDLEISQQKYTELLKKYSLDTIELNKKINNLMYELLQARKKAEEFEKSKIKDERDALRIKADSLDTIVSRQKIIIGHMKDQIKNEEDSFVVEVKDAKKEGYNDALTKLKETYRTKTFDDLVLISTNESVTRDMNLLKDDSETFNVLKDLQTYFTALHLLSIKYDQIQVENSLINLNNIKSNSELLKILMENLTLYKDFSVDLKRSVQQIVDFDSKNVTGGNKEVQIMKFNQIIDILALYIYNYYDYNNYPYLSNIIIEIIKRKRQQADSDISDLLDKL
ncbi:MAG: hypothetical protein R2794_04715 [Chitinophagales bacterium]